MIEHSERTTHIPLATPRVLAPEERRLVDFLLSSSLGSDELRLQAETVAVVGLCRCGCASVRLEVERSSPPAVFDEAEVAFGRTDTVAIRASGPSAYPEVALHVIEGRLFELEIWGGEYGLRPSVDVTKLEYELPQR